MHNNFIIVHCLCVSEGRVNRAGIYWYACACIMAYKRPLWAQRRSFLFVVVVVFVFTYTGYATATSRYHNRLPRTRLYTCIRAQLGGGDMRPPTIIEYMPYRYVHDICAYGVFSRKRERNNRNDPRMPNADLYQWWRESSGIRRVHGQDIR